MTIAQCLSAIDGLKYNTFTREEKLRWLSQLEARLRREVVDTHEGGPAEPFPGFTVDTDPQTELIAPEPYDAMYLHQLEAKMDYHSGEIARYNNSSALLRAAYEGFVRHYNRTHLPKTGSWKFP